MLVERMDKWLPELSGELQYSQKTYPVLIHGIPTSFNTSHDSKTSSRGSSVKTQILSHTQLHFRAPSSWVTLMAICIKRHMVPWSYTSQIPQSQMLVSTTTSLSMGGCCLYSSSCVALHTVSTVIAWATSHALARPNRDAGYVQRNMT